MSNEYGTYPCGPGKDGGGDPSRTEAAILALPAWERVHEALIAADYLDLGTRLKPAWRADELAHYEVPVGAVVVVATGVGLLVHRAYIAREDGVAVGISIPTAEDILDPAGAPRRAWGRRVSDARLKARPIRFHMRPGHGYEVDVVYDWRGQEYVALCTRACEAYVWLRGVTYAEAVELGIA